MHLDYLPGTFFGPSNLVELLRHRARCQPEDIAFTYLVDGEHEQVTLTYRELDRQARAIGAWLESHDLVGQRALLLYPAGLDFIAAFFGCLYGGVIAVPVYPPRRNRSLNRIQAIADDADARVALTTEAVLNRVMPLIDETPHLKQLTWLPTCQVPTDMEKQWTMPDVHGDTLAFLQYTSGSTGTPKGVVLNHANLMHNSALIACSFEHTRSGTGVFWLPSYHDMGLIGGILQPLYVGRPNILMSPMSFLTKPYRWLSAISRFRGTTSGGPNFAYDLCVRKITPEQRKTLDLSSWRVAFSGAEPVRADTLKAFADAFAPCGFRRDSFYPCYGLAEATLIVAGGYVNNPPVVRSFDVAALAHGRVVSSVPGAEQSRALVGCGENLPDQKIVIVDPETRKACPPDCVGEVWVHGPSVAQGYWRQPEISERIFRARLNEDDAQPGGAAVSNEKASNGEDADEATFLRTGDLGFLEDDELYITGRLKDLIIVRGVNYYPQDIERTVQRSHPRLRPDCGAAFVIDGDGRDRLVVVQEVERHKHSGFQEVFDAIRRAVAGEHELAPDAIVLIKAGSVPKTSSGKIQRHACRDGYLSQSLDVVSQWVGGEERGERREGGIAATPRDGIRGGMEEPRASESDARRNAAPARSPSFERLDVRRASTVPAAELTPDVERRLTELVVAEIRRVAKDRAQGMTLDSPIVETGLDSLERMEILATLEEKFGGRFPEDVLPDLETVRQLVAAVAQYLGTQPRPATARKAEVEIPVSSYRFEQFPEYVKLRESLDLAQSLGLGNPFFAVHEGVTSDRTIIAGREYINFASYNYLGMSGDPAVSAAAKAAIDRYGTSASASRLVSGQKRIHVELEESLTRFLGVEDVIAMVGGHSTNETVIGHLLKPGDLILHDALAHNSIVEGSLLSGARRRPFPHNDWEAADRLLEQYRHEYRRVLIAIEGVYSMDGDIPDLPRFVEVKKRHKALLMIDEAHSMGVLGQTGRGIAEHFSVDRGDVDIWMGTFSKSFGSCGGYIAGCKALVDYLRYTAPGFVFAAAMPPASAGAILASLALLETEPERVARLRENARLFLTLARRQGLNTGVSEDSPIIPVILGNSINCLRLSKAMLAHGVNVQPILHPAVEEHASRLRYFITALHTEQQIRHTIRAMAEELHKIVPEHAARVESEAAATG